MQTESSWLPRLTLGGQRITSSASPAPSEGSAGTRYKSYIAQSSNINWISWAGRVQHVLCTKHLVPQLWLEPPFWFRHHCTTFKLDFFVIGNVSSREVIWAALLGSPGEFKAIQTAFVFCTFCKVSKR